MTTQAESGSAASARPTGTIAFLFSDIEGSAARWERNRETMDAAVKRHDACLHAAMAAHDGYVFKTVGDAFCVAFARVSDAVAACADANAALSAQDFSAVGGLRVRFALHTGEAIERNGDYFGPAVNRVARLISIGHGGQILVSGVTRDLAHTDLPAGATLVDLGSQWLEDLAEPEHVWQLNVEGLPSEFPALRSLDAFPNNLPVRRTAFVGREHELSEVKDLLDRHHLVTLVGSGGVGKTRLAIQAGAELLDRYPDGVWFVDFAPITDPKLVVSVVAQALGMSQVGRPLGDAIPHWLKRKKLLLIFDNCEHVLGPAAELTGSILATTDVRILTTTREALGIEGEAVHRVPSLAVPAEAAALKVNEALNYGAVALFADRARASDTRFVLTDDTAPIVAEICHRLDGIPLAIELAAARVKVLSISNLAQRLNERFKLLTGGSRDALPRQKTLSALIDWSYDLLAPQEQLLFTRLGIFAGGFGLDAVTSVCVGDGLDALDVLDLLSSLTDKSLVVADTSGEQERYRLLESTATYALEKLSALERKSLARRHGEYFRDRAEAAHERIGTGSMLAWRAGVELELDNYRAALEWSLTDGNDAVLGGIIAGALSTLWANSGLGAEGRYWIELALERISEAEQPHVVARLLSALNFFSSGSANAGRSQRAMQLYESVGDTRRAARAQSYLAYSLAQTGRLAEASEQNLRALATLRECGDKWTLAGCLNVQAIIELRRGDLRANRELLTQALAAYRASGDEMGAAIVLSNIAEHEFADGHPEEALRLGIEALEIHLRMKNARHIANDCNNSATYRVALDDIAGSRESAREALRFARQAQTKLEIAGALQSFSIVAGLSDDARRAARLLGYVDARYAELGQKREFTEQWAHDKIVATLRQRLSDDEGASLAAEGAAWSEDQAVEEALKV